MKHSGRKNRSAGGVVGFIVVLGLVWLLRDHWGGTHDPARTDGNGSETVSPSERDEAGEAATDDSGHQQILDAFAARRSDMVVEAVAVVKKILPDDLQGSRHQKMILAFPSGHTILLAHNIDLAPRVPVDEGDTIGFRGEYEFSEQGGVVHWTHHDPQERRPGGWIRHQGRIYR